MSFRRAFTYDVPDVQTLCILYAYLHSFYSLKYLILIPQFYLILVRCTRHVRSTNKMTWMSYNTKVHAQLPLSSSSILRLLVLHSTKLLWHKWHTGENVNNTSLINFSWDQTWNWFVLNITILMPVNINDHSVIDKYITDNNKEVPSYQTFSINCLALFLNIILFHLFLFWLHRFDLFVYYDLYFHLI